MTRVTNSPKRSPLPPTTAAVQTPVAGVTSVPAPKRDGDSGAVNPGYSTALLLVDRDQRANPALVTEPPRLPIVRSLAGVPLKDPRRKGPPINTFIPGAKHHGRKGGLRSPWRWNLGSLSKKARENAERSGFRDGQ